MGLDKDVTHANIRSCRRISKSIVGRGKKIRRKRNALRKIPSSTQHNEDDIDCMIVDSAKDVFIVDCNTSRNEEAKIQTQLFYEDPANSSHFKPFTIPIYNTLNSNCLTDSAARIDNTNQNSSIIKTNSENSGEHNANDDSVIFVGEEILEEDNQLSKRKCASSFPTVETISLINDTINESDTSYLSIRCDSPPPNLTGKDEKKVRRNRTLKSTNRKITKRMVILDGNNVAYGHALNKQFSVKGLQICINHFKNLGHEVKAVVPQHRLKQTKSSDPALLQQLYGEGHIVLTPCKNLPGKYCSSYDDRFILQLAVEFDGAVISNDNYRDLLHEDKTWKAVIENRVIGYTWCNDKFILATDPYGRFGPTSTEILNRKI